MSNQPKMVPFTNVLGITMMVMETEVTVEAGEDTLPIDHSRWITGGGALLTAALAIVMPPLFLFFAR